MASSSSSVSSSGDHARGDDVDVDRHARAATTTTTTRALDTAVASDVASDSEEEALRAVVMDVARRIRGEVRASYAASNGATRAAFWTLVSGWLARTCVFGRGLDDYAALTPFAVTVHPWTLVTSGYYEMSLIGLVIDATGLVYIGRLLEPTWGKHELIRFFIGVNVCVTTLSWMSMYALYFATAYDSFYLFAKFSGFHGALAALFVALFQTSPEEPVFGVGGGGQSTSTATSRTLAPLRSLRYKHLIGLYLSMTALYAFMNGEEHHHIGLFLFDVYGAYSAWVYLRFFQPHPSKGARGDDSPDFAFAAFFPSSIRPVIARLTAPCGAVTVRILQARRRRVAASVDVEAPSTSIPATSSYAVAGDAAVRAKLARSTGTPTSDEDAAKRAKLAERGRAILESKRSAADADGGREM